MRKTAIIGLALAASAYLVSPVGQFPKPETEVRQCILKGIKSIQDDNSLYKSLHRTVIDMAEHPGVFPSELYLAMVGAMDHSFGRHIDKAIVHRYGSDLESAIHEINDYVKVRHGLANRLQENAPYDALTESYDSMVQENQLRWNIANSLLIEVPDLSGHYNLLISSLQHNIRQGLSFHQRPESVAGLVDVLRTMPNHQKGWQAGYLDVVQKTLMKYIKGLEKIGSRDDYKRWYENFDVFSGSVEATFRYLKDPSLSSKIKDLRKGLDMPQLYSPPASG